MSIVWLLAGIALAVVGAHGLVDGGVALSRRFGIPTLVVGAVVIGFGTSTPELAVNVSSALDGKTDLALGNVLGSNVFNICLVVGIVAMIAPMSISRDARGKDLPMCLVSALMVGIAGNQLYFDQINFHQIMLSGGLTFLLFFTIFMRYIWSEAASGKNHHSKIQDPALESWTGIEDQTPIARSIITMVLGLIGLVIGGELIVDGAVDMAQRFNLDDRTIGLLIVGPGTSLPELIASIVAAMKRESDMVLGNVLGSNIFNIFFTLGITAVIQPIPLDFELNKAILFNVLITAALVLYAIFSRNQEIGLRTGIALSASYLGYIVISF